MSSNIAVKITADVSSLQSQFAVAKAEASALQNSFNSLARQIVATGDPAGQLGVKMQQMAPQLEAARVKADSLKNELASLRPATQAVTSEMSAFSGGLGLAKEALASLGIVASAAAFVSLGRDVFNSSEEIYHNAEVVGLSIQSYQAFATSAKLAGVEVDTIEIALKRFNVAQGQAQTGVGDAAKAFHDLGVDVKLPADEALPAIARALASIQDPARRARDEVNLFGKSGEEMNPALFEWAQGVAALGAKLKDMGAMQSDEVVTGAHDAKVAMDTAWAQVDVKLAPGVVRFTGVLTDLLGVLNKINDANDWLDKITGYGGAVGGALTDSTTSGKPYKLNAEDDQAFAGKASPKPNYTDDNDIKRAAAEARRTADQITQIWQQAGLRHLQSEEQTNSALLAMGNESLEQWKAQAVKLENDRYDIELQGIQKREAADKGDKNKLAVDLAQEAQLAGDHADKLTAIDQEYAAKKKQIDETNLQAYIRGQDERVEAARSSIQRELSEHLISAREAAQLEIGLTRSVEQQVLARFDAEHAGLQKGTEAYAQAMKQREDLVKGFTQKIAGYDRATVDADMAQWKTLGQSMKGSVNGALDDMILHGASFKQGMGEIALGVVQGFLHMGEEMLENYIETEIAKEVFGKATADTSALSQISAAAGVAGANTFASISAIPLIGPFIAPGMAAAAVGETLSFGSLVAFDVGTNWVPQNMPAMVHQGERIIPRADNEALISAMGGGARGGDLHAHITTHVHPSNNIDMDRHAGEIVRILKHQHRIGAFK